MLPAQSRMGPDRSYRREPSEAAAPWSGLPSAGGCGLLLLLRFRGFLLRLLLGGVFSFFILSSFLSFERAWVISRPTRSVKYLTLGIMLYPADDRRCADGAAAARSSRNAKKQRIWSYPPAPSPALASRSRAPLTATRSRPTAEERCPPLSACG